MPQFTDFLSRFRPAGAPGAATRAGVPADRTAALAAELDPVLALLAATQAECDRLARDAERAAAEIAEEARARADEIAARGLARAHAARDEAANEVLAAAQVQATRVERSAAGAAATGPGPGEDEVRALIEQAVALVLAMPDGGRVR